MSQMLRAKLVDGTFVEGKFLDYDFDNGPTLILNTGIDFSREAPYPTGIVRVNVPHILWFNSWEASED